MAARDPVVPASADHRTPWTSGGERETLVDFLDYLRAAVVRKARDVPDARARRALVPSGTSLLGLVAHLTRVEVFWFQWAFAGLDVDVPDDHIGTGVNAEEIVDAYRRAAAASNDIVARTADLSTRCRRAGVAPQPMTLRWVLVHMIEETGRHAGHADILREQIDGSVGR